MGNDTFGRAEMDMAYRYMLWVYSMQCFRPTWKIPLAGTGK